MLISEFKVGQVARLTHFGDTPINYRRRLLSLGITLGVEVKILRFAPLGCPVQIEVRNTSLALRKDEARYLEWEPL